MALTAVEPDILFVAAEEAGLRIDRLLADRFPTHSRTYFQYLIDGGFVLLNGELVKKRIAPNEGDEIEVCFQLTPEISLAPEPIPLKILYEDEHLLAVDKPAGMVVHPSPGHPSGTFVNALLSHCRDLALDDTARPGIVHRLDKDTSGVLLAAKTRTAHQKLIEAFASRSIQKLYFAICCGKPPNTTIRASIGRHPTRRKEMAVLEEGGKEAVSEITVAAFEEKISFVLIRPLTGRTHQIRVHLKHIGHPVLGDAIYGNHRLNQLLNPARQMLHAYRLSLAHPITGAPLLFSAPMPADMKPWLLSFRLQPDEAGV